MTELFAPPAPNSQLRSTVMTVSGKNPDHAAEQAKTARDSGTPFPLAEAFGSTFKGANLADQIDQLTRGLKILPHRFTDHGFAAQAHDDAEPLSMLENTYKQAAGLRQAAQGTALRFTNDAVNNIARGGRIGSHFFTVAKNEISGEFAAKSKSFRENYGGASLIAGGHDALSIGANAIDNINAVDVWHMPLVEGVRLLKGHPGLQLTLLMMGGGASQHDLLRVFGDDPDTAKFFVDNPTLFSRFAAEHAHMADKAIAQSTDEDAKGRSYFTLDQTKAAYRSPTRMGGDLLRALPTVAALVTTAWATRGAGLEAAVTAEADGLAAGLTAQAATSLANLTRAATSARIMAMTEAATNAAVGYGQQYNQVTGEVMNLDKTALSRSSEYNLLIEKGFAAHTAQALLADRAAHASGLLAGAADALVGFVGGRSLGHIIGEGGSLALRTARGAVTESLEEGAQSALEQYARNFATQQHVDPTQDLNDGVLESIASGLFLGGIMGGASAGAFGRHTHEETDTKAPATSGEKIARLQREFNDAVAAAPDREAVLKSKQAVTERIQTQLNDVGQFSPEINARYADLAGQMFTVAGARTGKTAEQMHAEFPLRFEGEGSTIDGHFLEQDIYYPAAVDQLYAGRLDRRDTPVIFNSVPTVFRMLGLERRRLTMAPTILEKASGGKHDADRVRMTKLPAQIQDPVAILASSADDSLVAVVDFDRDNKPVVAVIGRGKGGDHYVASLYTKDQPGWLEQQARQGRLLYVDKARAPALADIARLQLPGALQGDATGDKLTPKRGLSQGGAQARKILTREDLVNEALRRKAANALRQDGAGAEIAAPEASVTDLRAAAFGQRPAVLAQDVIDTARANIRASLAAARAPGAQVARSEIAPAQAWLITAAAQSNLDLTGYHHTIDVLAIRHALKTHGNAEAEARRGQIGLTDSDFENIPDVLSAPDRVILGMKTKTGLQAIGYIKTMADGTTVYLEEVRTGKHQLAARTLRKHPVTTDVKSIAASVVFNARNDAGDASRIRILDTAAMFKQAAEPAAGPRGTYDPRNLVIRINQNADFSTVLHELGHFHLDMLAEMVSRPDAPHDIVRDMDALLDWFGIKGVDKGAAALERWNAMSLEEKRPYHEQFARGFELYLREGKAPSKGLRRLFEQFRQWLTQVYLHADELNVQLSDDVRGVMDRLVVEPQAAREAHALNTIAAKIRAQLDRASDLSPADHRAYADYVAQSYAVLGARAGLTAEQMYARYPLRIEGGKDALMAQPNTQPGADSPALTQPVRTLTGDEIAGREASLVDLRAAARDFYTGTLQGTSVRSRALDADVSFVGKGWKKAVSASADPRKLRMFAALTNIIAQGEVVASRPSYDPAEANVKAYHTIEAAVTIGDDLYLVRAVVREDNNGRFYYDHVIKDEGPASEALAGPADKAGGGVSEGGAYRHTLPQKGEIVNLDVRAAPLQADKKGSDFALPRGTFDPSNLIIRLNKNADFSTFLHELGHFHLEVLTDLASRDNAPAGIADDMRTLLDWFEPGLTLDRWNAMALDEKRPFHEQFARGVERYLFEGKAPTPELRGIFARFSQWLKRIYVHVDALHVNLSDEVRGVMDRLVALPAETPLAGAPRNMAAVLGDIDRLAQDPVFAQSPAGRAVPKRKAATLDEAREAVKPLLGKPLTNDATGFEATVSNATLRKMTSAKAHQKSSSPEDHALAVANVDQLFANAVLDHSSRDARGEPTIRAIHRFVAPLITPGGLRAVKMTVKETTHPGMPNPLYTVESIDLVKSERGPGSAGLSADSDGTDHRPQSDFTEDSIAYVKAAGKPLEQSAREGNEEAAKPERGPSRAGLSAYPDGTGNTPQSGFAAHTLAHLQAVDKQLRDLAQTKSAALPAARPGLSPHARATLQQALGAIAAGEHVDTLMKAAGQSRLRGRAPDVFHDFVSDVAANGPLSDLYVHPDTLAAALQSADGQKAAARAPEFVAKLTAQIGHAAATGQDVRIGLADAATHLSDEALHAALSDHIRLQPDGMTRAEAQAALKSPPPEAPTTGRTVRAVLHQDTPAHRVDDSFEADARTLTDAVEAEGGDVIDTMAVADLAHSRDIPVITLKDLEGKTLFATYADRTAAAAIYEGIDASKTDPATPLPGGVFAVADPHYRSKGVVWIVRGKGVATAMVNKAKTGAQYMLVLLGSEDMHQSNLTFSSAYYSTIFAYLRDGRMSRSDAARLTEIVRKGAAPDARTTAALRAFPGFDSQARLAAYVEAASFETRRHIMTLMKRPAARSLGVPSVQQALDATREPALAGHRTGDGILVVKIDPDKGVVALGADGIRAHPDYPYGIQGEIVGRLKDPVNKDVVWQDWLEARRTEAGAGHGEQGPVLDQIFARSQPAVTITPDLLERIGDVTRGRIQTARQARLATDSALNRWRDSGRPRKDGGISISDFVQAIRNSPARATLTEYTAAELKKGIRDKTLRLFQLGDDGQVFFMLKKGPDDRQTLTSIMDNEPGGHGVATAAVVIKALEEGATHLDCLAVKSDRYPQGYLPTLYGIFGFTKSGAQAIEPQGSGVVQPGAEKARDLADQQHSWAKSTPGHDPTRHGPPQRLDMKWSGRDAQRGNLKGRYLKHGAESLFAGGTDGDVRDLSADLAARRQEPSASGRTADPARVDGHQAVRDGLPVVAGTRVDRGRPVRGSGGPGYSAGGHSDGSPEGVHPDGAGADVEAGALHSVAVDPSAPAGGRTGADGRGTGGDQGIDADPVRPSGHRRTPDTDAAASLSPYGRDPSGGTADITRDIAHDVAGLSDTSRINLGLSADDQAGVRAVLGWRPDDGVLHQDARNVPLSEEARAIQARKVAADTGIEAAIQHRGLDLPDAPKGVDASAWGRAQELADAATTAAQAELQARAMRDLQWVDFGPEGTKDPVLRRLQNRTAELRQQMRAEVEAEVAAEPVNRARDYLKTQPLDRDLAPAARLHDLTKTGGLHPDMAAAVLGYDSGEALVRDLLSQPSPEDTMRAVTTQRLLAEHGDLIDAERLARAGDEAVFNDARTQALAAAAVATDPKAGDAATLITTTRTLATKFIEAQALNDLRPELSAAAVARAGKAARAALDAGDATKAAVELRKQLYNAEVTRAAFAAHADIHAAEALFAEVTAHPAINDLAIVAQDLLADFGYGERDISGDDGLSRLQGSDPQGFADIEPFVVQTERRAPQSRNRGDLSIAGLRGLKGTIDRLVALSQRSQSVRRDGGLMPLSSAAREVANAVTTKPTALPAFDLLGADAVQTHLDAWAKTQGPAVRDTLIAPLAKAVHDFRQLSARLNKRLSKAAKAIDATLKPGRIDAPELGYTFGAEMGGNGMAELIGALRHTGNAAGLARLLGGRGWAAPNWQAFLARMHAEGRITQAHWDYVQTEWDIHAGLLPALQSAHEAVYGAPFDAAPAQAVQTPFGLYEGGFVAAVADLRLADDIMLEHSRTDRLGGKTGVFLVPQTQTIDLVLPAALALDVRLAGQGLDTALRFATLAEPMRDLARLTRAANLAGEVFDAWIDGLSRALPAEDAGGRLTGEALSEVRGNTVLSALFAEMADGLGKLDVHGLDTDALADAALRLMRAPGTTAKAIADASPKMADRLKAHMQAMHEAGVQALKADAPWSQGHADFLTAALDHAADQTMWLAAYNDAVRKGTADPVTAADAYIVETPRPPFDGVAQHLPHLNAHFPKTGIKTLSRAAQSLDRLGTLAPALSAARLPNVATLKPWLPASAPGKLPTLPTLPTSRNSHVLPAPDAKAAKASLDPAHLVSALTGISDTVESKSEALPSYESANDSVFMQSMAANEEFNNAVYSENEGIRPLHAKDRTRATFGLSTTKDYRTTFFKAYPSLDRSTWVHHAVEQRVLKLFPGVVTEAELHSLENLRGIPSAINRDLHLRLIRLEWNRFYRENRSPTKNQLLEKATEIDKKYGEQFVPPVRTK